MDQKCENLQKLLVYSIIKEIQSERFVLLIPVFVFIQLKKKLEVINNGRRFIQYLLAFCLCKYYLCNL